MDFPDLKKETKQTQAEAIWDRLDNPYMRNEVRLANRIRGSAAVTLFVVHTRSPSGCNFICCSHTQPQRL